MLCYKYNWINDSLTVFKIWILFFKQPASGLYTILHIYILYYNIDSIILSFGWFIIHAHTNAMEEYTTVTVVPAI